MDDDLTNQLKRLGDATEAAVEPVTAAEALGRADDTPHMMDIGLRAPAVERRSAGRTPSRRVLIGAAAAFAVLLGSIAFLGRTDDDRVGLASAGRQAQTFTFPDDDNGWQQLRMCESKSTYDIDTGNTFYGAYQLTREMFRETATALQLFDYADGNPTEAPPHIQDAVANTLYLERGADPWPVCGRHITGPMITPVVPEWLQYSVAGPDMVAVFVDPDVDAERTSEIGAALTDLLVPADHEIRFVSREEAFVEFQTRFVWTDDDLGPVSLDTMPARFEISSSLDGATMGRIRAIDDVFEVVPAVPLGGQGAAGPLRLSIPAIGLETPIYPSPTNEELARAAVLMVDSPSVLVVGGYRSQPGSVFDRIDELNDGDTVRLTTLVETADGSWEMTQSYEVDRDSAPDPPIYDLDDMLLWRAAEGPSLTLVGDVEGEPTERFVLRARLTQPDRAGYPITSDG